MKSKFHKELSEQYSKSEIEELFSIFCEHFLNLNKIELRNSLEKDLSESDSNRFSEAISELKTGKPYQQILGETEFYGMRFFVNEHVLIPRPETEELLELAIGKIQEIRKDRQEDFQTKILDIGTGSGIIPIVLKTYFPEAELTAIDISDNALEIARKNAEFHKTEINYIHKDYLNENLDGIFDIIISNPPYIGIEENPEIEDSVKGFEPNLALFSPTSDALIFYRKIAEDCKKHLAINGLLFLEINQKLGKETLELYKNQFSKVELLKDISGNDRIISGVNKKIRKNFMKYLSVLILLLIGINLKSQSNKVFADSIQKKYKIPELGFAVISSDSILEIQVSGVQRINTDFQAKINDRFHIGSNTKAITSFLAALLVDKGKIKWNTKFLDLFPELKPKSKKEYLDITLQDLLTFRGKLPSYTYTFENPKRKQITGNNQEQRFQLAKYFLSQKPMETLDNGLTPSNADYILAGLMLEKSSGKYFKELVTDFGETQGIDFGFDYPNLRDIMQPWGHDISLNPLPPFDNYKLNWLLSAGNINVSLPDYIKFVQLQLKGLKGQAKILDAETFNNLMFGLSTFSFGWFNKLDTEKNLHIAYNEGNAGAFITQVEIVKETNRAYIIFTNSAREETKEGLDILMNELKKNGN